MATASNACLAQEQPWLADNAAMDHVTSSLNHLSFPKPYNGQDHLTVDNGQNLSITHIGNSFIPSSYSTLHLNSVLRVHLLHQILPLSIKPIIITIAGAILMKTSFPLRLWPQGKCFTRARVKVKFIPSILIKHHNFLCHLRSATVLLGFLLSINLFGI